MTDIAVVPAAGYGRRMAPLSDSVPKEMLPVGRAPMIELAIRDLSVSGIKKVCVVIRKGKEIIKEYLDSMHKRYNRELELSYVFQPSPLGLGDAIRSAADFIGGKPFVMAIPDQVLLSDEPATAQLLRASVEAGFRECIWNSMVKVPKSELAFFRGSRPFSYCKSEGANYYIIEGLSSDEDLTLRGFGRTLYVPGALRYMTDEYINEESGEVDLLKTFDALKGELPLYGTVLKGTPCDLGSREGYYHYLPRVIEHFGLSGELAW